MGEAVIHCHGVQLTPEQPEETDEKHMILIEGVEDEYYVRVDHEMTKSHYISFMAAFTPDGIQMIKLYPEGAAEARFKTRGVKRIYFYCNRDGLFYLNVHPAIDGKRKAYDDSRERAELEKTARILFG
jgi:desulfoferrodoxin (superoxide reductase-like protein)